MKAKIFSLLIFAQLNGFGQSADRGYSSGFIGPAHLPLIETGAYGPHIAVYEKEKFSDPQIRQMVKEGFKKQNLNFTTILDTAHAFFYFRNISPGELAQYEYQVNKIGEGLLVPWTSLDQRNMPDNNRELIGKFRAERGKFIKVDLRRKNTDTIVYSSLVLWKEIQPQIINIFLADEINLLLKRVELFSWGPDTSNLNKWKSRYKPLDLDAAGIPKKLELEPTENSLIFYLNAKIQKAKELEYQLMKNGKIIRDWDKNEFDHGFIWLNHLQEGEYEIKMRYQVQPENITSYKFKIKPRWDQTLSFKLIAGSLLAAFFGFIILLVYSRRQKQRLRREIIKKQRAEAELKSVYAQLNPHFIFNALSSIQGLIIREETDKANHYLSTFSKLLRDSLMNGEKNEVPLSAEISILETYLQLEQLRFGFNYRIEVKDVDPASVEVPALFLQPLVENAIKHGVSALQEKGDILIRFSAEKSDLVIKISDNGPGFDPLQEPRGFGLKLTRQRMALINEFSREKVQLNIQPGPSGTTIIIIFKNLLS